MNSTAKTQPAKVIDTIVKAIVPKPRVSGKAIDLELSNAAWYEVISYLDSLHSAPNGK